MALNINFCWCVCVGVGSSQSWRNNPLRVPTVAVATSPASRRQAVEWWTNIKNGISKQHPFLLVPILPRAGVWLWDGGGFRSNGRRRKNSCHTMYTFFFFFYFVYASPLKARAILYWGFPLLRLGGKGGMGGVMNDKTIVNCFSPWCWNDGGVGGNCYGSLPVRIV